MILSANAGQNVSHLPWHLATPSLGAAFPSLDSNGKCRLTTTATSLTSRRNSDDTDGSGSLPDSWPDTSNMSNQTGTPRTSALTISGGGTVGIISSLSGSGVRARDQESSRRTYRLDSAALLTGLSGWQKSSSKWQPDGQAGGRAGAVSDLTEAAGVRSLSSDSAAVQRLKTPGTGGRLPYVHDGLAWADGRAGEGCVPLQPDTATVNAATTASRRTGRRLTANPSVATGGSCCSRADPRRGSRWSGSCGPCRGSGRGRRGRRHAWSLPGTEARR